MVVQALKHVQSWAVSGNFDRIDCTSGIFTTMQDITATSGVFTRESSTLGFITSGTITQLVSTYDKFNAGSPWTGQGKVLTEPNWIADVIISGGMWVIGSAASGRYRMIPAPASTRMPLGVCLSNTALSGVPSILVNGFYYFLANGDTTIGAPIGMGASAGLNAVIVDTVGSMTRGIAMDAVSSGTAAKALVYLF